MDPKVCSRCVAEFTIDPCHGPRVDWGPDAAEDRRWVFAEEVGFDFDPSRPLPSQPEYLVPLLKFALRTGRRIDRSDGSNLIMVDVTWNGDPVCIGHLLSLYQHELHEMSGRYR